MMEVFLDAACVPCLWQEGGGMDGFNSFPFDFNHPNYPNMNLGNLLFHKSQINIEENCRSSCLCYFFYLNLS